MLHYHPALSEKVHSIVKQYHPILNLNDEHCKTFNEIPRVTYRRAKNLKDGLVRASLPLLIENKQVGSAECGEK